MPSQFASHPAPLGRVVLKGLTNGVVLAAYMATCAGLGSTFHGELPVEAGTDNFVADTNRPVVKRSPAALVAKHHCWTGVAPADMVGELPGHVVVTSPNGNPAYGGERMVGKALDQVFGGVDHGLTVAGFCR